MQEDISFIQGNNTSCAGSANGGSGHPLVYLEVKQGQENVICPYCSRKFVIKNENWSDSQESFYVTHLGL